MLFAIQNKIRYKETIQTGIYDEFLSKHGIDLSVTVENDYTNIGK